VKSTQALRQAILRHAFTGKLVPQDPSDEPAWELLKRIAAERGISLQIELRSLVHRTLKGEHRDVVVLKEQRD